jgi:deoxycytidine triphosphate deaminase
MSTLPYQDIKNLIAEANLVSPADIDRCLGPASYELRIGSALNLGERLGQPIAIGQELVMRPQSHVLIGSMETVRIPKNLCADLSLKSKFGRAGFLPWFQGFVDPGYEGKLTFSLVNLSLHPVILKGGQGICHIVFRYLTAETQTEYKGEYKGSNTATGPKTTETDTVIVGSPLNEKLVAAALGGIFSGVAEGVVGKL